jgi:protein SCO1/2
LLYKALIQYVITVKKQSFFALVASLVLVLAAVIAFTLMPGAKPSAPAEPTIHKTAGIEGLGGSWALTDHNGQQVTDKDFTGTYRLMSFGFTYCPDVCPTELKRLSLVLEGLGEDAAAIKPLFVTVDPARDTPDVLKEYLGRFDERFIGLTGTIPQIENMEKIFKVYSAKAEDSEHTEYMVNHSALVYLIGPDDKVLHLFHSGDTPPQMIALIRQELERR